MDAKPESTQNSDPQRWVDITFDCIPLRTIGRFDIPMDASPKFRELCERIRTAIEKHGAMNTYYLHNAKCTFHVLNSANAGMLQYRFEGVVITDADDLKTKASHLQVDLVRETCDWLTEPVARWWAQTVSRAVEVEFDRYIAAGDLKRAKERMEKIRAQSDQSGGYLGMYL